MTLTEEEKREIDELARAMPKWQKHLAEFRERHPEMSPQEVMKKAGFTFRMKKGKLVKNYIKKLLRDIIAEASENYEEGKEDKKEEAYQSNF